MIKKLLILISTILFLNIFCFSAYSQYIYCAGETTQKVWKIDKSDMSKKAESIDYGGVIYALTNIIEITTGIKWNTITINKWNTIEIGKWNTMQ